MSGCSLLADPLVTTTVIADGTGLATAIYELPDSPLLLGDLYAQWFWFDLSANALGLVSSRGVQIQVR